MKNMSTLIVRWGLSAGVVAAAALATGCTTVRQEFRGRDAGQVWTAMQAVAQSPEYRDWHVMENEVWVDPNQARLEIFRVVERSYNRAGGRPWHERKNWKFQVSMEETDPPIARFTSRGLAVPARASEEGRRFFADVRRLLYAETHPVPVREANLRVEQETVLQQSAEAPEQAEQ